MWELDCEESWALKNWYFWTVVLEKIPQSPLDCKEIQPVHPKGDQSWVFIGRTDAKAETPILWPPHVKSWLIWKDPDAGKDWGLEEKGTTEDEMAGWHHRLDGHEFEWTPGVGDGQGGLACCDSWGRKESDTTDDWTELTDITDSSHKGNAYITRAFFWTSFWNHSFSFPPRLCNIFSWKTIRVYRILWVCNWELVLFINHTTFWITDCNFYSWHLSKLLKSTTSRITQKPTMKKEPRFGVLFSNYTHDIPGLIILCIDSED